MVKPSVLPPDLRRLERYGTALPLAGGLLTTYYGVHELKHAKNGQEKRDGVVDVALGTTSFAGTVGNLPVYASILAYGLSPALLATMGAIGGVSNVLNGTVDGTRDIVNAMQDRTAGRITQAEARHEYWNGGLKIASGLVVGVGSILVRPDLMIAGSTLYGGICAWQNRDAIKEAITTFGPKILDAAERAGDYLIHTLPPRRHTDA